MFWGIQRFLEAFKAFSWVLCGCERFLNVLKCSLIIRGVLRCFEAFLCILSYSKKLSRFWNIFWCFGMFRGFLKYSHSFWAVLKVFLKLWAILWRCWGVSRVSHWLRAVQKCSWRFWGILWYFKMFWDVLNSIKLFWTVLKCIQIVLMWTIIFWEILRHSEAFWWVLSSSEGFSKNLRCSLTIWVCYYVFWSVLRFLWVLSKSLKHLNNLRHTLMISDVLRFLAFWGVPTSFNWFWAILKVSKHLRHSPVCKSVLRRYKAFCASHHFCTVLIGLWRLLVLYDILRYSDLFWDVLMSSELFWKVSEGSEALCVFCGEFWCILMVLKGSWRSQTFSAVFGCSEAFWGIRMGS